MRSLLLALVLASLVSTVQAQPQWTVESSSVTFVIRNAGLPVDGSFEDLKADLRFEPGNLEGGRFDASIDVSTIDTGIGRRDRHLRSDDYFDAETYPRINMKSTAIRQTDEGAYEGTFDVTIKDVTQSVVMPFTFDADTGILQGRLELDRTDYGVGGRSLFLAEGVAVDIMVQVRLAGS
ncbi:MAG: YceI family protein [Bacteroidota bacterium]